MSKIEAIFVDGDGYERDVSDLMRKLDIGLPEWEYGGTFRTAWRGCGLLVGLSGNDLAEEDRLALAEVGTMCRSALRDAHVVNIDLEQFNALPRDVDYDLLEYEPDPHLPFNPLYVSVNDDFLAGFLVMSNEDTRVAVLPFWSLQVRSPMPLAIPVAHMDTEEHRFQDLIQVILGEQKVEADRNVLIGTMADTMKVMRFLESANVEIDETPVSRQVRRSAGRRGVPIAQTVTVRSPRRTGAYNGSQHEEAHFSHRFEVRGHYKHYGPETRLFRATLRDRPHKIINHPTRGQLVRLWCPDFVKGPDDRPLVPKVRVFPKKDAE